MIFTILNNLIKNGSLVRRQLVNLFSSTYFLYTKKIDLYLISQSEKLDFISIKKSRVRFELKSPEVWLTLGTLEKSMGFDFLIQSSQVIGSSEGMNGEERQACSNLQH